MSRMLQRSLLRHFRAQCQECCRSTSTVLQESEFLSGAGALLRPSLRTASMRRTYICSQRMLSFHEILQPCRSITTSTTQLSTTGDEIETLTSLQYEKLADETLDLLSEFFDVLGDSDKSPSEFDVTFSSGVLTVSFGKEHGTYVINKQTPNKQIWLSSPTSGPKRYDYVNGRWIYAHDGRALHDLLTDEVSKIIGHHLDVTEAEQLDT